MSFFTKQWKKNRKWDPITHGVIETVMKQDSKLVRKVAKAVGWRSLEHQANRNVEDPVRGVQNAAAATGIAYGGAALYGAYGGGAGAGAAAGEAAGAGAGAGGAGAAAGTDAAYLAAADAAGGLSAQYGSTAAYQAGISGAGGAAGATGAGSGATGTPGATGGDGAFLGEGTQSGVPQWDGAPTSTAGPSGSPESSPNNKGTDNYDKYSRLAQNIGGGGPPPQQPLQQDRVVLRADGQLEIVPSSRKLKQRTSPRIDAIRQGVSGADPISSIGVQMAAIKQLSKDIEQAEKKLARRKGSI